jgi:site-specific DNA-cytosine methylase
MNVLSLFDGMSCGQIALNKSGLTYNNYFASEIEPNAIKVTQHNYPTTYQLGDVTQWDKWNLPQIDLLIGGSPCQGFSFAGKQLNFNDPRSKLFFEYVKVLEHVNPKYFLLENVGMKEGHEQVISQHLGVEPIRINSELVSPQLRNRLYWTNIPTSVPKDKGISLQDILEDGYTDRRKARALLEGDSRPNVTPAKMFHRYYSTGFSTLIFKSEQHYWDCVEHYETHYKGLSAEQIKDNPEVYNGVRYMTQSELEQCQTVPIGYTSPLTRNQAASVLGNGWTVDVIAHIFEGIKTGKTSGIKQTNIFEFI